VIVWYSSRIIKQAGLNLQISCRMPAPARMVWPDISSDDCMKDPTTVAAAPHLQCSLDARIVPDANQSAKPFTACPGPYLKRRTVTCATVPHFDYAESSAFRHMLSRSYSSSKSM
jgi:hypothetical protein